MTLEVLVKPVRQNVWDWPAVINLTFAAVGCGFYLIASLAAAMSANPPNRAQAAAFQIASLLMIALGFLAVAFEAGRPLRSRYLLRHLRRSWMSVEVLAGLVFMFFSVTHIFFPRALFMGLAAAAALCLLLIHGLMVYRCRAVIAWNVPIIPIQFLASGLCLGFGFWLIWTAANRANYSLSILVVGLSLLLINAAIWANYLFNQRDESFRTATQPLRRTLALTIILGFGCSMAALLLLFLILGITLRLEAVYLDRLSIFAGAVILAGGVYQRAAIVLKVNYLRELTAGK